MSSKIAETVVKDAYHNTINGEMKVTHDNNYTESTNPATGQTWTKIPLSTTADAEDAIQSARTAFSSWSALSARERGNYLRKVGDMLDEYGKELLTLETLDTGWIQDEYGYLIEVLKDLWYDASAAAMLLGSKGKTIQMGEGEFGYTLRKPYGVVAAILPWNAPLFTFTIKAAYALAGGNTVVVKPSEQAAVGSLRYGELLSEILPKGTINVVSGKGSQIGDYICGHREVNKVSLTGSIGTAELIAKATASLPKSLVLELGGKSPNIVFEDANIDEALFGVMYGIYTPNAGQICAAGSRILVQKSIFDQFVERMQGLIESGQFTQYGDTLNPNNTMGPISNAPQYKRVCEFIDEAKAENEILFGGNYGGQNLLADQPDYEDGYWVEPTLVKVTDNTSRIYKEEVFGPVAVIIPFETEEEAIQIANDTNFGLASGVWTEDLRRAHRLADKIDAGNVWVNTYARVGADLPFGGIKESGYGTDSILEYTQEKACVINIAQPQQ